MQKSIKWAEAHGISRHLYYGDCKCLTPYINPRIPLSRYTVLSIILSSFTLKCFRFFVPTVLCRESFQSLAADTGPSAFELNLVLQKVRLVRSDTGSGENQGRKLSSESCLTPLPSHMLLGECSAAPWSLRRDEKHRTSRPDY